MDYYIMKSGQQVGPFSEEEVRHGLEIRDFDGSSLAWCEGSPDWMPLSNILPMEPELILPPPLDDHDDSLNEPESKQSEEIVTSIQEKGTTSPSIESSDSVDRQDLAAQESHARSIPEPPPRLKIATRSPATQSPPIPVKRNVWKMMNYVLLWSAIFFAIGLFLTGVVISVSSGEGNGNPSPVGNFIGGLLMLATLFSPILVTILTVKGKLPGTRKWSAEKFSVQIHSPKE